MNHDFKNVLSLILQFHCNIALNLMDVVMVALLCSRLCYNSWLTALSKILCLKLPYLKHTNNWLFDILYWLLEIWKQLVN